MRAYYRQNTDILCLFPTNNVSLFSHEGILRLEFYILLFLPRNFIAGRRQAGPSITPGVMDDAKLSANSCNAIVRAVAQSILSLSES